MRGMAHQTHRPIRTSEIDDQQLLTVIDDQITAVATMALIAGDGEEDFPVATVTHSWSTYGTGYRYEAQPEDPTNPSYLARRQIFMLLSDPNLALIPRALQPYTSFHPQVVIEDAGCRLSEMLEWQVMRPSTDGGLSLARAATSHTSIIGWARKFITGPNGARKVATRVGKRRDVTTIAWPEDSNEAPYQCGLAGRATGGIFDVEAIAAHELPANEVTAIVNSRARALAGNRGECPKRIAAEAAAVTESFNLPEVDTSDLPSEVASVLLDLLLRQPELAFESLNEHARRRCVGGRTNAQIPEKLVDIWRAFSKDDVLLIRSLERGEAWVHLLASAALGAAANTTPAGMRARSSQG